VGDLTSALDSVDTGAMKLALFGRTRGRGAKVQEWPDVQFIVATKARSCRGHCRQIPAARCEKSLETTPEENLLMAYETIACLQDNGLEVIVDLEHAMDAAAAAAKTATLRRRFQQAQPRLLPPDDGAMRPPEGEPMVVCDTTGGASPEEVGQVIGGLARSYPDGNFGFHGHTDRGLGVANTRAAFWPARCRFKARCWEPASAAAT
jgi:2-isopropylmalate synthase